jgi:hypothetical protein
MVKKKEISEFECLKCRDKYKAQDSFHGKLEIQRGEFKDIKLCSRCLDETIALWNGETEKIKERLQKHNKNGLRGCAWVFNRRVHYI